MLASVEEDQRPTMGRQQAQQRRSFLVAYGGLVFLLFFTIQLMDMYAPFGAGTLVLLVVLAVAVARPALGLGLTIVLTVAGDPISMDWWPVAKNMSARESILYASDGLTIKPLEVLLATIVAAYFISRRLTVGADKFKYGPMWRPLLVFTATMMFGLVYGLGRGGDFRIAVFEITPMLYIPMVYLAATNLFTSMKHYRRLMVGIILALVFDAIYTLATLPSIRSRIAADASPLEHTAVLHMNLLLLLFVCALWFGTRKPGWRLFLFVLVVPTLIIYLDTQRRAGVVALIIGGIAATIVLYTRNKTLFYRIIPVMLFFTAIYSAAFWNNESAIGFPAQAVKTVITPDASTEKDSRSDLYREIENFNLNATIRSSPILGIGFGHPFLQPISLPNISFFEFADYIPHNSVLWVWTKTGVVGFVAFLFLIAKGTARGVRAAVRFENPDDASLVLVFAAYLPMLLVLAFVEIAYDPTTTVLLGLSLAFVSAAEELAAKEAAENGDPDGWHFPDPPSEDEDPSDDPDPASSDTTSDGGSNADGESEDRTLEPA